MRLTVGVNDFVTAESGSLAEGLAAHLNNKMIGRSEGRIPCRRTVAPRYALACAGSGCSAR